MLSGSAFEDEEGRTDKSDIAWSYGLGVSTVYKLGGFGLLTGVRYLGGSTASFLSDGLKGAGRSRTDMIGIHIGITDLIP